MKIIKFLLKVVAVLAALLGILGFFAKKSYQITRSIDIHAPNALVQEHIRSFKKFDKWSPWNELDTNVVKTYAGTDGEANSSFSWKGNDAIGEGTQTITSIAPDQVNVMIDMLRPLAIKLPVAYKISGDTVNSKVTITINPVFGFPTNVWAMFTDIDKAFGKDYERALGNLKKVTEQIAHPMYNGYKVYTETLEPVQYFGVRDSVKMEEVPAYFEQFIPFIFSKSAMKKQEPVGPPAGLYWTYHDTLKVLDMATVMPFSGKNLTLDSMTVFTLGGDAISVDYLGAMEKTGEAHTALKAYMKEKNLESINPVLEVYLTDTEKEPDTTKWLTKVTYFVKPKGD